MAYYIWVSVGHVTDGVQFNLSVGVEFR